MEQSDFLEEGRMEGMNPTELLEQDAHRRLVIETTCKRIGENARKSVNAIPQPKEFVDPEW